MDGMTRRIVLKCIDENFLGLGVAAVGHVNVGLGDRIDSLVAIDGSDAGLTEVSLNGSSGIDRLPASRAEHRVGAQVAGIVSLLVDGTATIEQSATFAPGLNTYTFEIPDPRWRRRRGPPAAGPRLSETGPPLGAAAASGPVRNKLFRLVD